MSTVLRDLLSSKKFIAAAVAVIIWVAGRFGFDVDPAVLDRMFAALLVYVGAQGAADVGKSAAIVTASAAAADPPAIGPRDPQAGRVRVGILASIGSCVAIGALVGWVAVAAGGCATTERAGTAAKNAVVDCGKQYGPGVAASIARWAAESAIAGRVDWAAIEESAKALGVGVGGCAVFTFWRAFQSRPRPELAARATVEGPADDVAQGEAVLARLSAGWGGATWTVP